MEELSKIYVFTRAFNAEKTIRRAIDSVLTQSYHNITYVVRDNGSTDNTYAICKEYAQSDKRIILVHNQKNHVFETDEDKAAIYLEDSLRDGTALGEDDFFCLLDADDEYLPDFFEKAVELAHRESLDIVVGGTALIQEETGAQISECTHGETLLLEGRRFSDFFPTYHWYTRQVWGKLYRRRVLLGYLDYHREFLKKTLGSPDEQLPYGADTIYALYAFRRAKQVGILPGCAHRYYIQRKSVSTSFPPHRTASDTILHNAATDFLIQKCGFITPQNRNFLQIVYAYAVIDTVEVIRNTALSPVDKLREYHKIASNPITLAVYRECTDVCAWKSRERLLVNALESGAALDGTADRDLREIMQTLLPRCGRAVTNANAELFLEDSALMQALLQDDADRVLDILLERLEKNRGVKRYDFPEMVRALVTDDPLLCQIDDAVFLRNYARIYRKIWKGNRIAALDEMAGILLENKVRGGRETFLNLFISLAAMEEQASAFILGKIQLAWLYLRQGHWNQARTIVADLTEMGVENEELGKLREKLGQQIEQ